MKCTNVTLLCFLLLCALSSTSALAKRKHVRGTVPIPKDTAQGTPKAAEDGSLVRSVDRGAKNGGDNAEGATGKTRSGGAGLPKRCEEKHAIETFVQISGATRPQASKKGGVYFLSDLRDSPQIFFLASPNQWPRQISFFPDGVPYFQVSPDGEKILIATHVGGDEQYDIYLLEPSQNYRLTPLLVDRTVRIESVAWDTTSQWFAYTSNERNKTDMDLYRYDLKGRKSELLAELKGQNGVSDVSPNGKLIAYTNFRSVSDSDVLLWDIAAKTSIAIAKENEDTFDHNGIFTGDSKGLFYLSDVDKGYSQLYLAGWEANRPTKLISSEKWEVEDFNLDASRSAIAYVVNEEGYGRLTGFELDNAGRKRRNLAVPNVPNAILSAPSFGFSPSRRSYFFAQTSSTKSSDIWEWKNQNSTQWTQSTHALMNSDCFSKEELVHYPSFDKREIPAFLYYPRDAQGPVPFIVYVHGGPESQYRPGFSRIFQYFLERGFGVLAPNVRGSTGYGREYTRLDNYKNRMDSVKDAIEGAKWLLAKRYTSPGKLAIYGGSYGGFMVLRCIQVEPDLFAAASESVGITNFVTFLKNTKPYRRALREVEYGPLSDEEFLKSISPMTYLDRMKTPLLIFHGANDPRVPVSEAEQVIKELKRRDVPVDFKIFADEGHGNTKLANIMEQAKLTVYFFEKHVTAAGK